jgi:signal transduction histidine kinase
MIDREKAIFPPLFSYFFVLRFLMLILLCVDYLWIIPDDLTWIRGYVWISMVLFTVNHFLLQFHSSIGNNYYLQLIAIDFLVASGFGFLYPGFEHPFPIFYGILLVTLILAAQNKAEIRFGLLVMVLVWGAILLYTFIRLGYFQLIMLVNNAGFVLFSYLAGYLIRHYQRSQLQILELYEELEQSHQALQEAHQQLQSYARQVEELTEVRERNRIAREIHDTVGHTMTALLVQLQVAKTCMQRDPTKLDETLHVSEELARSALQNVRLSVRALKEEKNQSFLDTLRKLVSDFSEMTGTQAILQVEGDLARISVTLQSTIYRIIQESLTNAKRHGDATEVCVELRIDQEEIRLDIADNGTGTNSIAPSFGLQGMRERVQEFGGSIQFVSETGCGFQVFVRFPLYQQVWKYGGGEPHDSRGHR